MGAMDDRGMTGLLIAAGLTVAGVAFLSYSLWARRGRSPAARRWISKPLSSNSTDERMTVLGAPLLGLMCLCFAAGILPVVGPYLIWVTFPIMGLLFVPFLWVLMRFIPLPMVVYPRWARPLRERNRRAEQAMRQYLRERR